MRRKSTAPRSIDGEDRISRLPNTLIHHILSFMDMKYVVQTSVLSKRWTDVWTTISTLKFNSYAFHTRENVDSKIHIGSFANFINEVFILRGDSSIQRFHLDWNELTSKPCTHKIPVSEHINTWIIAAVRRSVQDLSIQINAIPRVTPRLPHCLLNSQSLTKLVLKHHPNYTKISLPNSMSLPRLKLLSLSMFYVEEVKLLDELISSCPVLESLILANISVGMGDDVNLNIESRDLKHFYLHSKGRGVNHPRHTMAKIIKLSTPNLTSLICHDYMIQEYFLENLSSLVTAKIKMTKENDRDLNYGDELSYLEHSEEEKEDLYPKRMMKMLGALHNVEKLTLSASFVQVLSKAPDLTQWHPLQFHNLQWLKLTTCLTRGCLAAITYLLKISTKLESLILMSKERRIADVDDDWEARLSLPCTLSHLKFVEIQQLQGCNNEFKFVEFLRKNGVVLQEMVLWFRDFLREVSSPEQAAIVKKFSKKLRTVPRASSNLTTAINVEITYF